MRRLAPTLVAVLALSAATAGCSGDDEATSTSTSTSITSTSSSAGGDTEPAHGAGAGDADKYGSSMDPDVVSVADIAELGPGPEEGDEWKVWTGINVCGRFVDIVPTAAQPAAGLAVSPNGLLAVAPLDGDPTGHDVTVRDVLALYGMSAETGALTFPDGVEPATLDVHNGSIAVAGQTLSTGDACPDSPGEVQVWYYTPQAVDEGHPLRVVVTDPQDVPIVADGSAVVVAFSPTSSLPTLPPAALIG